MPEYAVFSRRILTGTISDLAPSTRIAWIAILFEAEKLRGRVKLPVRDLAKLASITTPEAAEALRVFQEPDPFSSTKDYDGRRLIPIKGEEDWYQLVAWEKHAAERQAFFARLRQQRARDKKKPVTVSHGESRRVMKEPEPEPEQEPELSTTEAPSPEEETVTRTLGIVAPGLKATPEDVRGWLTMKPDPWWVSAVICENELHLRKKPSVPYLTKIIERRVRDDWKEDDLKGYVRNRWSKAS